MNKDKYVKINNLLFPKDYLFSFKDPNGGIWISKLPEEESVYRLGVSSIMAVKLEELTRCTILDLYKNKNQLIDNEIFLYLKGFNYEMNLFSPFTAKIEKINTIIEECSEVKPVILTQESVYEDHWLLEVEIEGSILETGSWFQPENKRFQKMIDFIVRSDSKLRDRCCPNLLDSSVVRRLQNKEFEEK